MTRALPQAGHDVDRERQTPDLASILRALPAALGLLLFLASIFLCLWKYSEGRSLWLDESFVAVSIRHRTLSDLFRPLEYSQQFPRVYLAMIWLLTRLIGYETWVLRLLPLLFGVAALMLWTKVIVDEFQSCPFPTTITALLLLLFNYGLYQYVGDLKQYTGDLFWGAFAYYYAARTLHDRLSGSFLGWWRASVIWSLPVLFSNPYVLIAVATAVVVFLPRSVNELAASWKRYLVLAGCFLAVCLASYLYDVRFISPLMPEYWRRSFIAGHNVSELLQSFLNANARLFSKTVLGEALWVPVFFAYSGFLFGYSLVAKDRVRSKLAGVGGLLAAELLLLAWLRIYPIDGERLGLFFYPFAVALIVKGIDVYASSAPMALKIFGKGALWLFFVYLLVLQVPAVALNVYRQPHWENLNPAVASLRLNKSRYVVYGSWTKAQVEAYPHLPAGFSFVSQHDLQIASPISSTNNPWLDNDFYYLVANPDNEPFTLMDQLRHVSPHLILEEADPHLLFFKSVTANDIEG